MNRLTLLGWALVLLLAGPTLAQPTSPPPVPFNTHVAPPITRLPPFVVQQPDKQLRPFTGLTRRHWRDAARYLLAGAAHYGRRRPRDG